MWELLVQLLHFLLKTAIFEENTIYSKIPIVIFFRKIQYIVNYRVKLGKMVSWRWNRNVSDEKNVNSENQNNDILNMYSHSSIYNCDCLSQVNHRNLFWWFKSLNDQNTLVRRQIKILRSEKKISFKVIDTIGQPLAGQRRNTSNYLDIYQ